MDSGPDSSPDGRMTPWSWRVAIGGAILLLGITAYFTREFVGLRGQAAVGVVCFFGLVAMFSSNLRAVNWRTIGWGLALQLILAILVLKVPGVREQLEKAKTVVVHFIDFSDKGAEFVFGNLARPGDLALNPGKEFL